MTDEPGAGRWSCSGNTSAGACSSYSGSTRPCVSRASPAAWQVPGERGPAVRERGRKRLASMQISYREGPGPAAAPSSPPDIRVQCQRPTGCAGDRGPKQRGRGSVSFFPASLHPGWGAGRPAPRRAARAGPGHSAGRGAAVRRGRGCRGCRGRRLVPPLRAAPRPAAPLPRPPSLTCGAGSPAGSAFPTPPRSPGPLYNRG